MGKSLDQKQKILNMKTFNNEEKEPWMQSYTTKLLLYTIVKSDVKSDHVSQVENPQFTPTVNSK